MNAIERTRELKASAESYFALGFNITGLKNCKKAPYHPWEEYQFRRQTKAEAMNLDWADLSGIGAITGISELFCLDFDECDLSHVPKFLEMLGLPENYNWVVVSASSKGFHIWFSSPQLQERLKTNREVRQVYLPKMEGMFKQIELRINCLVVMPPSKSVTGNMYKFLHPNDLSVKPQEIIYENNLEFS
jgi:hypothetical protein